MFTFSILTGGRLNMLTHVIEIKCVYPHYVNTEVYKVKGLSKRLYTIVQ